MSKTVHRNHSNPLPTDRLTTTEVSSILGIHRNTLKRMTEALLLPPDGKSGGGRSYWFRSTVDAYRLGALTTATIWFVRDSPIEELNLSLQAGHRILGQTVANVPLTGSSRTEALAALLSFVASAQPHALALPSRTSGSPTHQLLAEACRERGIPLVIYPS